MRAGAHLHDVVAPVKSLVWAEAQVLPPKSCCFKEMDSKSFPQNLPCYRRSSRSPFWRTDPAGWEPLSSSSYWQPELCPLTLAWFLIFCVRNRFWPMLLRLEEGGHQANPWYHSVGCSWAWSLPVWGQLLDRNQLKATNIFKEHLRLLWQQLHAQGIHFCLL